MAPKFRTILLENEILEIRIFVLFNIKENTPPLSPP